MGRKEGVSKSTALVPGATTTHQPKETPYNNPNSPPRTPPEQIGRPGRGKGGVKAPRNRPAIRDAFDYAMKDEVEDNGRHRSNSHGLTWSPKNARASVVDNMLLSLDNLGSSSATATYTATLFGEDRPEVSVQPSALSNGRQRGHTISSSISSDYSLHAETPSPAHTRRQRSNSSNNFQSSLGRIDSIRVADAEKEKANMSGQGYNVRSGNEQLGIKRSGKGSVSSSINRRSSSFDNGHNRLEVLQDTGYLTDPHDAFAYTDFDAAPTPTVPGGPRGPPVGARPGSSLSSAQTQPLRRRGSTRSPMGIFGRSERADISEQSKQTHSPAKSASQDSRTNVTGNPITPARNYTESRSFSTPASAPITKDKERPGFFKRVFGSSRGGQSEAMQQKKQSLSQGVAKGPSRVSTMPTEGISGQPQLQLLQKAPAKDLPKSKEPVQTLNKKTSFFRRRRKSVQDASSVPTLPPQVQFDSSSADHGANRSESQRVDYPDSPGSLRRVMDPYLENHRRMGSECSNKMLEPRALQPTSGAFSTIRAVSTTQSATTSSRATTPNGSTITTSEPDIAASKSPHEHRVEETKGANVVRPASREKTISSIQPALSNEKSRHSPAHIRTQSDVDKNLPRLPVDYNALATSGSAKEVPTSKYNTSVAKTHLVEAVSTDSAKIVSSVGSDATSRVLESAPSRIKDRVSSPETAESQGTNTDLAPASELTLETFDTTTSKMQAPVVDNTDDLADETLEAIKFRAADPTEPSDEQQRFASKLFSGTAGIERTDTAPWLGEAGPERAMIRRAYMDLFDWKDMSILTALRSFCTQVQLKGETQQVDRVLDALSTRWCDCNPNHGFKATDVVHTICYSLLLLNTDLHLADIEQKMTRSQFIKNTMPTIRRVVADAAPNAFVGARGSLLPPPRRHTDQAVSSTKLSIVTSEASEESEFVRPTHRLTSRPSDHSGSDSIVAEGSWDDCGPLVKMPFYGKASAWELQVEVVLKNFYNSIRQIRLPLSGEDTSRSPEPHPSSASFAAMTGGMLRRTNSMLSKAGSETLPARGRLLESRTGSRWSSKARSRPRLYAASLAHSRTSFEDDQSAISPSMSSMWSKYSLGKTQTSMSVNSFSSDFPQGEYQRSIGFANALSQAIIRDDSAGESNEELVRVGPLLDDESLELEGAPWAKEGLQKHKHHLEAVDKRAKDRNWSECFTVIEKGWIRLFQFNMNAKSLRQKARKNLMGSSAVVGGGNWTENAQCLGEFLLRHTIASELPSPGYSKTRPHVWALSLPTGAVHLFQAGTPEIVKEFVSTANYWSARLSNAPLVGGVSNMEYGWSDRVINMALLSSDSQRPSSNLATNAPSRPSFQTSIRNSIDQSSSRPKLPGDRVIICDWTPPAQSMVASQLLEVDQLRALLTYVKNIEEELRKHNEFRGPIQLTFTPRMANHGKAMSNWERKSSYLLREIVKFRTYLESLQFAQKERERIVGERAEKERMREGAREGSVYTRDEPLEMA